MTLRARLRRLGFGVVAFFRPTYRLKDRKNGGFLHQPTALQRCVAITPRANRRVLHHSRNGVAYSKKAEDKTSAFLLVTLNQPKSNLFAGISDTLKREPSESVVAIAPRANRRVHHHSRTGASKNAHHSRCAFCW